MNPAPLVSKQKIYCFFFQYFSSFSLEFNTKSCTRKTNQIALKDVINNEEMKNANDDRSNVKFTHPPIRFECDICGKKNILKRYK